MNIRWPLVSRKKHEHTLAEHEENARLARILLDDEHEKEVAALKARHEALRREDLEAYQAAVHAHVIGERRRCAMIAEHAPITGRAKYLRDQILKAILDGPRPPTPTATASTSSPPPSPLALPPTPSLDGEASADVAREADEAVHAALEGAHVPASGAKPARCPHGAPVIGRSGLGASCAPCLGEAPPAPLLLPTPGEA